MYGNCDVCGKRFGTTGDGIWHEPCEHMVKKTTQNLPKADAYSLLAEVRELKARNGKLTDIINWMSNGHGIDHMEIEYDIEMAELESEHFI